MSKIINGLEIENIPWENRPENSSDLMWRYSKNPVIGWNPTPSTSRIYNSAVIKKGDRFVGVFRADHKNGRAFIHYGESEDALNWNINDERIHWVDEDGNQNDISYGYDPRIAEIDGRYYITWCDDFPGASIGLGYTDDFKTFIRLPNAFLPFNRNGVLFPRKVNGKYMMLTRPSDSGHTPFGDIYISESPDMIHWGKHKLLMTKGGHGWWQGVKIGTGPVPVETDEGWLLLYHGVSSTCNGFVYSMGGAILDADDPSNVKYRCSDYILTPEKDYEVSGFVPNVLFPCAALVDSKSGKVVVYYGAADTFTSIAFGYIDDIIKFIKDNHEDVR